MKEQIVIQFQGLDGYHETLRVPSELISMAGVVLRKGRYYVYGGLRRGDFVFNETVLISLDRSDI